MIGNHERQGHKGEGSNPGRQRECSWNLRQQGRQVDEK